MYHSLLSLPERQACFHHAGASAAPYTGPRARGPRGHRRLWQGRDNNALPVPRLLACLPRACGTKKPYKEPNYRSLRWEESPAAAVLAAGTCRGHEELLTACAGTRWAATLQGKRRSGCLAVSQSAWHVYQRLRFRTKRAFGPVPRLNPSTPSGWFNAPGCIHSVSRLVQGFRLAVSQLCSRCSREKAIQSSAAKALSGKCASYGTHIITQ